MKKALNSIPLKLTAILLSYVMVIVLVVSVTAVAFMGYFNFYFNFKGNVIDDILGERAIGESYTLEHYHKEEYDINELYSKSNIFYTIETEDGKTVQSSYNGQEIIVSGQNYSEKYIYTIYIPKEMTKSDEISLIYGAINVGYALRYWVIVFAILSLVAFIAIMCYLYCSAGHKEGYSGIRLNYLDLIPTDIYAFGVLFCFLISYAVLSNFLYEGLEVVIALFILGTLLYFLTLGFTMSLATRIKTRTLFKNTVVFKILRFIGKVFKSVGKSIVYLITRLPLIWKTLIIFAVVLFGEFVLLLLWWFNGAVFALGLIYFNVLVCIGVLYVALTLQKIKAGGEKIANGELDHKIDTKYMFLDFKDFSENLNNINEGLQKAVDEKMKSELFKTELITNVSHDIKTPLTSIINYVDLLKKEEIENRNANEYIDVLDRQSNRLKKLIEDLVEASKASTGNLKVNLAPCDISVLLSQTIGEFDDRFNKAQITPVLNIPNKNVIIKADARHLWRVIDNLLNNICKYSQESTRAYIDVREQNSKAVISFKNISRYQLNISSDELMERFVRGDKSRHTEGSGLGLSIAKSLTELQNGELKIEVDGDLFKVELHFDTESL